MGELFERLPRNYRMAIDKAIKEVAGISEPDIAELYRESEAESLLEGKLSTKDSPEQIAKLDFENNYGWFREGYHAGAYPEM